MNDYIFMKLGSSTDQNGDSLDGHETMEAYMRNIEENGLGYSWFSTQSLHFGMAKEKVKYYNQCIKNGESVKMLFAVGNEINDICYSANVLEIVSGRDEQTCPGIAGSEPDEFKGEEHKIWIKISDLEEETALKASMLKIRSSDANLKSVITNSQYHFGYVYLPEGDRL